MLEQYAGSIPDAVELLASAAERLDGVHRVRALTELGMARFRLNDMAGVAECAVRIEEAADHNDPEQRMLSDFTRGAAATTGGDVASGRVLLRDVIDGISGTPLRDDPRSLLFLALAAGFLGDPRDVMALGSSLLSQARNRGALGVLVPALALFAAARAWLGDHAGAFADAGEASELGDQLGYATDAAVAVEMLAWQSAARGLHSDADRALRRARSLTDRAGTTAFAAHQASDGGVLRPVSRRPGVGRLAARGTASPPTAASDPWASRWVSLPTSSRPTSRSDAERRPWPWPSGSQPSHQGRHHARLRALVARCRGLTADDDETAEQAFEAALAAHAEAPDEFESARTHLLYGARLRRERSTGQGARTAAYRARRLRQDGPHGLGAT